MNANEIDFRDKDLFKKILEQYSDGELSLDDPKVHNFVGKVQGEISLMIAGTGVNLEQCGLPLDVRIVLSVLASMGAYLKTMGEKELTNYAISNGGYDEETKLKLVSNGNNGM